MLLVINENMGLCLYMCSDINEAHINHKFLGPILRYKKLSPHKPQIPGANIKIQKTKLKFFRKKIEF